MGARMKKLLLGLLLLSSVSFAEVKSVDDSNFKAEVLDASNCGTVVVVDVYADWCGACQNFSPMLDAAAANPKNANIKFVRIDSDHNNMPPNIQFLPTVIIYKPSKAIRHVGTFESVKEFQKWLDANK
jgi:thioredoxin-like negative regulator of GroEL